MTTSLWHRNETFGTRYFDAAIIGGGIAGISAALAFERAGLRVAVIESNRVASGASGRNAGYLMRGMAESYAVACEKLGRDRAAAVWRWSEQNLSDLRELGIADNETFRDQPSCLLAISEEQARELERSHEMLLEDGFESRLCGAADKTDSVWKSDIPSVGLLNPSDATCHPVQLVARLASNLETAVFLSGTSVHAINADSDRAHPVIVRTTHGVVRAGFVLACLNAYAQNLFPSLRGLIVPKRGQMLAAKPRDPDVRLDFAYYANHGNEYFRQLRDGTVIFGGARRHEPSTEANHVEGTHPDVQSKLEEMLGRFVTPDYEVVARWGGAMGFTSDDLPLVGPLPQEENLPESRVWICGGFTGHGMSLGHRTATIAAKAMLGQADRPAWARTPSEATPLST